MRGRAPLATQPDIFVYSPDSSPGISTCMKSSWLIEGGEVNIQDIISRFQRHIGAFALAVVPLIPAKFSNLTRR